MGTVAAAPIQNVRLVNLGKSTIVVDQIPIDVFNENVSRFYRLNYPQNERRALCIVTINFRHGCVARGDCGLVLVVEGSIGFGAFGLGNLPV